MMSLEVKIINLKIHTTIISNVDENYDLYSKLQNNSYNHYKL